MATNMTISQGFSGFGLAEVKQLAFAATGGSIIDETVLASATNQLVVFTLDVSEIKAIYIVTDGDLTMKTNSSGSPAQTIALKAGQPLIWYTGCLYTNLLATDITALYFTNGAAVPVNISIRVITDATP